MRERSFVIRVFSALSLVFWFINLAFAADFPPVNPAELKITSLPSQPGAPAFILEHEEHDDDQMHFHSVYMRIKVLTEAGRENANVELPYNDRNFDISGVHGRTIHADGTIIPFEGKPFEKVVVKGKDIRYKVKAFTMPDVQVGSIIEYKYELRYEDDMLFAPKWTLQEDMYQQKVHFIFKPWNRDVIMAHGRIGSGYAWTWHTPHNEQPVKGRDTIEITLKDVPPFVEDEYMPPADILKYYVFFYYQSARSSDEFWKDEGKFWSKDVEHFANKSDVLASTLSGIVTPSDTPEQKVRKIYAFVTKLENTSYLPDRSAQEQKALGLKENKSVADVLRQTFDVAPTLQVHERKSAGKEIIAEMNYIRRREEDDNVAVRVAMWEVNRANLFAVEMDREVLIESDYRQRFFGRRWSSVLEEFGLLFGCHSLANVIVSDDRRFGSKCDVAARVISVPVRVENEAQFLVGYAFEGGPDLVSQRRKLIVDDQKAIVTNRDADVSAGAFEHVNIAGNFRRLHLHF